MSDPFDRLRDFQLKASAPDPDEIREKARRIRIRRHEIGAALAMLLLVIAGSLFVLRPTSGPLHEAVTLPASESPAPSPTPDTQPEASPESDVPAPGEGAEARSGMTSAGGSGTPLATAGAALSVKLRTSGETASVAMPIVLRLEVCNQSSRDVAVPFSTEQRYDFEIRNLDGELIWRWGADRVFAQVAGSENFAPGCRVIGEEDWPGTDQEGEPVEPGTYEAIGVLTSNPEYRSAPSEVCAFTC